MMKAFLRKTISAIVIGTTIITLAPLGVSAEENEISYNNLSYTENNQSYSGWKNISGSWYYFYSDGTMNIGWINDQGNWYHNSNLGVMQKGWLKDNNNWYYLNDFGVMQIGWVNISGSWYYFDNTGSMKTGWISDNGTWYYADNAGKMIIGSLNIDGKSYYFNQSGAMETSSSSTAEVSGLAKLPQNYSISIQNSAEAEILQLMNKKRAEAGLEPLTMDSTLLQVARYKSNHMIQYNYFDHTTPEGTNWTSWLKTIGYQYTATAENIAYNTYDPVELFNQWWNSEGHRENMMNPSYTKVGIGVINGNGKYMGTQTFSN